MKVEEDFPQRNVSWTRKSYLRLEDENQFEKPLIHRNIWVERKPT